MRPRIVAMGVNMADQVFFRYPLIDPVRVKFSSVFNFDRMVGGVASKLLLKASVTGHMMKLNFFSLSVFWYNITTPVKATIKQ